jgi:hypothetical protein
MSDMANPATYDDANLMLRLYELRREEKLRQAREWFARSFAPANLNEANQIAPPGSAENAYFRMVVSYWEMACSFVTSGVLNQELFFQSSGELMFVWERIRHLVPEHRAARKNPAAYRNLETVATAMAKWMGSLGPETYPAFQEMVRGTAAR